MTIGVLGLAVLAFNVTLMIADRAPRVTRLLLGDLARALSERIDTSGRTALRDEARRLARDDTVHVGVWLVAVVLVALAVWSWRGLALAAVVTLVASIVVELGQGRYSTTRVVERSDLVYNAVGVLLGTLLAAIVYLAWDLAAMARADRRARLGE
ncbi:MAG: hypothetical protein HKN44_04365 [Ilumatobacter sp.]|nr:hypothetical protein [Ilumatobacter sp.]